MSTLDRIALTLATFAGVGALLSAFGLLSIIREIATRFVLPF